MRRMLFLLLLFPLVSNACNTIPLQSKKFVYFAQADKSHASSFAITTKSGKTFILTNWHVCQDVQNRLIIKQPSSKPKVEYKLPIIGIDPAHDLCILPFKGEGLKLAKSYNIGERVAVLGHPNGVKEVVVSMGRILYKHDVNLNFPASPTVSYCIPQNRFTCSIRMNVVDTSAFGIPGSSGGPVINMDGEVIGIINNSIHETKSGSMIPLEDIKRFLSKYE